MTRRKMITIRNQVPGDKKLTCKRYRCQEDETGTASMGRDNGSYLNSISTAR
ncbi:hypothetical protein DPMN_185327 [Dreissena polymorpha]|uniref:Uncharacterized protein n=1 Tax=Dreissena polymorpha TaxID=45954 RepID=A0A9D4DK70_DREPO|nr:hypothetical protein DPMN_185327 [Dreissena polymorpha]